MNAIADFESAIYLLAALFAVFLATLTYLVFLKGRSRILFGGKVEKTYGEVALSNTHLLAAHKIKVHKIANANGKGVGIELEYRSLNSYQTTPILLNATEAQQVVDLINLARNET